MVDVVKEVLEGFGHIFTAPMRDLSILWLLIPIVLFWLILEIYFGRYKKESLGWNTALGNGLNMFWIVAISSKALFTRTLQLFSWDKLAFIIFVAVYSIFIIYISFTHKIREGVFFLIASPTAVYYLSAIAVLWIHDLINITIWVLLDLILLYIAILLAETLLKKLIPQAPAERHSDFRLGQV